MLRPTFLCLWLVLFFIDRAVSAKVFRCDPHLWSLLVEHVLVSVCAFSYRIARSIVRLLALVGRPRSAPSLSGPKPGRREDDEASSQYPRRA